MGVVRERYTEETIFNVPLYYCNNGPVSVSDFLLCDSATGSFWCY
jgi:hypothetical protein